MKIDFKTIKQYNGTMDFDNHADFDQERADMRLDPSIVSFKAYAGGGVIIEDFVNENAQPITKHCPLEKSWVGTKTPTEKELRDFGDTV